MKKKTPILLLTRDRATLLEKVLDRLIKYTNWDEFELWILDNMATPSTRKIINVFKYNYPWINIFEVNYNQIGMIQNAVITSLKRDVYIKIDDDILVTENWTNAFLGVYQRHYENMSFGSVTIPINGFGWVPFMEIMNLKDEFKREFPDVRINQDCMDVAVYNNKEVNEFLWRNCLDLDETAKKFASNQNGQYSDLFCPHRYSIGAIVFGHSAWEKMGGWAVQPKYDKNLKRQKKLQHFAQLFKKKDGKSKWTRLNEIANIAANVTQGWMGYEEQVVYDYSMEHGLKIPVTTEGLVYHFSFGPVDQFLMNRIYKKIKF